MTRLRFAVVAALALAACNQTTIPTPLRSFDRPSDVALACVMYDANQHVFDVRDLGDCEPHQQVALTNPVQLPFTVTIGPTDPLTPFLMALVTQSARGELALVDTAQNKLVDADPLKTGYGFIPVGDLPEHVRTTGDGCVAVTANVDSCDYGIVDVPTVINQSQVQQFPTDMAGQGPTLDITRGVHRVPLAVATTDGNGNPVARVLGSRPGWIEMAPENSPAQRSGWQQPPGGTPGKCTAVQTTVHKAWVALPSCGLVVRMNLDAIPTAPDTAVPNVDAAVRVTPTGAQVLTAADLAALSCPDECGGASLDGGAPPLPPPDAAPSDMGAPPPPPQSYPGTLAVDKEGGRLVIGDLFGERIDIVPIDNAGNLGTPRAVRLEAGAGGVSVVRVSPRSQAGKYLYAIARDNSVRVVDLDREVECETNPDPRFAGTVDGVAIDLQQTPTSPTPLAIDPTPQARLLGCFPLGQPDTPPRAPLATSPGIQLTPGQLPADVAFVHIESPPGNVDTSVAPPAASPGLLVGDFAWIASSDGRGTVVDIFDACPQPNQQDVNNTSGPYTPACSLDPNFVTTARQQTSAYFGHPQALLLDRLAHRLRGGHPRFVAPQSESDPTGMARVALEEAPCSVLVPANSPGAPDGGAPDGGACSTGGSLPGLFAEPVPTNLINLNLPNADPNTTRVVRFVDPDKARNETWEASWEGTLPGSERPLGALLPGGYLADPAGAWCYRGVLAGDKLVLRGCTVDSDCDQASPNPGDMGGVTAQLCVHDPGAFLDVTQGMCEPVDNNRDVTYWSANCGKLLRSQRKYRILSARQNVPPPGQSSGATDLLQFAEIYEPEFPEQTHTCKSDGDCTDVGVVSPLGDALTTKCLGDVDGVSRCLLPCAKENDDGHQCGTDFECAPSRMGDLRCMRAPLDDALFATCMPELQQYEIHAGDAFLIAGSLSGMLSDVVPDASGECRVPPATNEAVRLRQSRVPMSGAPPCPAGMMPLDSIDPHKLAANVCAIENMGERLLHYENHVFNIALDVPESGGPTPRPIVPPDGTTVSMTLTGGGSPISLGLGVDVQSQHPRAMVVAPDQQTVYIVDEGKSNVASGLRGQLLRLISPGEAIDSQFVIR